MARYRRGKRAGLGLVSDITRYENGRMDHDEIVEFFQGLVDNGTIYSLQGSYQRTAENLIRAGYVQRR